MTVFVRVCLALSFSMMLTACSSDGHSSSEATHTPTPTPEARRYLFLMYSDAGELVANADGTYLFRMQDVWNSVVAFSDRPFRDAVSVPLQEWIAGWNGNGFATNPPNAAITMLVDGSVQETDWAVMTLRNPRFSESGALEFDSEFLRLPDGQRAFFPTVLGSGVKPKFLTTQVFIDSTGAVVPPIDRPSWEVNGQAQLTLTVDVAGYTPSGTDTLVLVDPQGRFCTAENVRPTLHLDLDATACANRDCTIQIGSTVTTTEVAIARIPAVNSSVAATLSITTYEDCDPNRHITLTLPYAVNYRASNPTPSMTPRPTAIPTATPTGSPPLDCSASWLTRHPGCSDLDCVRSAADEAFCQLEVDSFESTTAHWVSGHAFDTILDYFLTSERGVATARDFAEIAINRWRAAIAKPGEACWYDDFGWWTIAAQRAAAHPELWRNADGTDVTVKLYNYDTDGNPVPSQTPTTASALGELEKIRDSSWEGIDEPATQVFADCVAEDFCGSKFASLEPLYTGGVWNNRWSKVAWRSYPKDSPEYQQLSCHAQKGCDPTARPDPEYIGNAYNEENQDYFPLCGIQNTVTNGLHLIAANRLYRQFSEGRYLAAAEAQLSYFEQWLEFDAKVDDPQDALVGSTLGLRFDYRTEQGSLAALVRERTSVYSDFAVKPAHRDPYWFPILAWAGDQGLLLGGLVDSMARLDPSDPHYQRLLALAKDLLRGVRGYLVTEDATSNPSKSEPGWLLPWRNDPRTCSRNDAGETTCIPLRSGIAMADVGVPPGNDRFDHDTGIAAFMRYLVYAYDTNADLRAFLQNETDYPTFLQSYASHVAQDPYARLCLYCDNPLMTDANRLAVLVAAIRMWPAP